MEVVIVYESLFGNTRRVAEAIASGAKEADPVAVVHTSTTSEVGPEEVAGADVVIVGGPTHLLGMSRPSSRRRAFQPEDKQRAAQASPAPGAAGPGVREWLETLPMARPRRSAAAFDTRLSSPLAGGAARGIARQLRRHGYRLTAKPAGFVVEGAKGPLRAGDLDRARAWGAEVVRGHGLKLTGRRAA
ncbi:MAG: hypothetical protein J2O39_07795 [Acidimicrobiales bacterium]|nr:hypothetical protein [Acidimicrobiales bacterium]MBO0894266.1 hypothetical protein [Acidimicrobiales bacterium]